MRILVSWSSGKDSAWMLHVLRSSGAQVSGLLTTINESADRVAMHGVRTSILQAQARAAQLPLTMIPLPEGCSNEIYEERMRTAVTDAVANGFTHIAFGDLFLEDVRRYREDRLNGSGLTPLFPLWHLETTSLSAEMLARGVEAYVSCVDLRVLPCALAGSRYGPDFLRRLPEGADPCGEKGEFHTCVVAGPMFSDRIPVTAGQTVVRGDFAFADLVPVAKTQCG